MKRHFGVQGAIVKFPDEMKQAGIELTREWINWGETEPVEGQYDWSAMDEKVHAANRANIEVLGYFVNMPSWAKKEPGDAKPPLSPKKKAPRGPKPPLGAGAGTASRFCAPKDINDFRRFAKDVAARYDGKHGHGKMHYIGILNEVTLPEFFDIKNTDYEPWLTNGYYGVKEGNPEAKVSIGSFINPLDAKGFVDRMLKDHSEYYDIVDYHAYGQDDTVVSEATRYLKARMTFFNVTKPMWLTETSTVILQDVPGIQSKVACELVKRYVRAFGEGAEKVFWFTFVGMPTVEEDGRAVKQKTVGLGWAVKPENVFHPRQAYHTHRLMVSKMHGFSSVEKISDTQYEFRFPDRKPVYVLWRSGDRSALPSGLTGTVVVTDYLGNAQVKQANAVVLTEAPVFLETKEKK